MKSGVLHRSIVVGIIVLFVCAGVISLTVGTIENKAVVAHHSSNGYIQGLIDNASDGDTIYIPSGIYYECIIINKSISLVGEDQNTTIIDSSYSGDVVNVTADMVNISRFTITHGNKSGIIVSSNYNTIADNNISFNGAGDLFSMNAGIYVNGSNNLITHNTILGNGFAWIRKASVIIEGFNNTLSENFILENGAGISVRFPAKFNYFTNNIIRGNWEYSIYISQSANNVITGNNITNNSVNADGGIYIWNSNINGNIISKNTMTNNGESITLINSSNTIISSNIISNYWGIKLFSCHNNTITNNSISYCGISLLDVSHNNIVADNTISNASLSIEYSNENTIINNNIVNNSWFGINLFNSNNNSLIRNNISNKENGISLSNSSNNDITTNIISKNKAIGIMVQWKSNDNNISFNDITLNIEEGIFLLEASENIVLSNSITENEDGIELEDSSNNIISENLISSNNDYGVEFHASSIEKCIDNTITYNTIESNNQGVYFENSSNNTVLKNNFLRNKRHALFENCINIWIQNYWNRPRILPKLIFGTILIRNMEVPWFNIDWRPAFKPYNM